MIDPSGLREGSHRLSALDEKAAQVLTLMRAKPMEQLIWFPRVMLSTFGHGKWLDMPTELRRRILDGMKILKEDEGWVRKQVALRLTYDRTWSERVLARELCIIAFYKAITEAAGEFNCGRAKSS